MLNICTKSKQKKVPLFAQEKIELHLCCVAEHLPVLNILSASSPRNFPSVNKTDVHLLIINIKVMNSGQRR